MSGTFPGLLSLRQRDRGCRFPGCGQSRWVDAHHIKHWVDGGETRLDNLITLCRYHHRLLHKGSYRIERHADSCFQFINSKGQVIQPSYFPQFPGLSEAADIEADHQPLGLDLNLNTAASRWEGDDLDVHFAVDLMFQHERISHKESATPA
ncbi:MAG: HNH endonuclease [Proteobacteria bacterium]|nr:HNH endonuclease [Pseudomonadota bacterium]